MQNLIVTDAGLAALINAKHSGTTPITISQLRLGDSKWTADASATALKNVTKVFDVQYGGTIDPHTIQVAAIDQSEEQYKAYEMGIYTDSGVLFAVIASEADPIVEKYGSSIIEILCQVVVKSAEEGDILVGNGELSFITPNATDTTAGIVELATAEEITEGTDDTRAITPKALRDSGIVRQENILQFASVEEVLAGVVSDKAIAPDTLQAKIYDTTRNVMNIKGYFDTLAELKAAHETGEDGDMYLVGKDVYAWDGEDWSKAGSFTGPQGSGLAVDGAYDSLGDLQEAYPTGKAGQFFVVGDKLYTWSGEEWKEMGAYVGPKGTTYVPSLSEEGVLTWEVDGETPPTEFDLVGKTKESIADGYISKSGNAGTVTAYETGQEATGTLAVNELTGNEVNITSATSISVSNGTSDQNWTKVINIASGTPTISLTGSWKWINAETPSVASPCVLVLHWGGSFGLAQLMKTTA